MRLGGPSEVAKELGVSLARVSVLRQRPDFPDPLGEIAQGQIWDLDVVREWNGSSLRRTKAGRPSSGEARRTLGGRFILEKPPIGRGGFADVYRAVDKKTGGTVAIKVLRDVDGVSDEAIKRFKRELRIMERLSNPNVVPVLGHGETDDDQVWYAMPLAQGSLADFIEHTPLSPPQIVGVMRQVCAGLTYIHEQGIYHRDLKPANVLRLAIGDDDGEIWAVSDFGLAVQVERDSDPLTSTRRQGMGSWVYTAPEQWQRARSADHVSDVYSLGKVLQELITRETPINAEIPPGVLRPVAERAIANDPASRYQSVPELMAALERSIGAKSEHDQWESREEEAERLRDRLLSRPTPEDLIQVLEWGLALDERDADDVSALLRVLPWMDRKSVEWLWARDGEAFGRLIGRFSAQVGAGSFSFERCDTFANFLKRVAGVTSGSRVLGQAVCALVRLGAHHNRWHVRDVLVSILQGVRSDSDAAAVVEALLSLPMHEVRWSITDFTIRSLPPAIRTGLVPALQDAS